MAEEVTELTVQAHEHVEYGWGVALVSGGASSWMPVELARRLADTIERAADTAEERLRA